MASIHWELDLHCSNCKAHVQITSDLGDSFKLSRDYKTERLLKEAEVWISLHPKGDVQPYPKVLIPFIEELPRSAWNSNFFRTKETPTRYVKCPICKQRIYVC